jgi:hypothetical protein
MPTPFLAPSGLGSGRASAMLDSNVWRYLVDEGAPLTDLKRRAREVSVQIVACPAVAYEALRTHDQRLRDTLLRAITQESWSRLMPEAYREAAEVYTIVDQYRPEWIRHNGDLSYWYKLQADWSGGNWWRRARRSPSHEASAITTLGGDELQRARSETKSLRGWAHEQRLKVSGFQPNDVMGDFPAGTPGWRGEKVEGWRAEAEQRWWDVLRAPPHSTPRDWIDPWVDGRLILDSRASWIEMWLYDVSEEDAPLNWLRASIGYAQMLQSVGSGTPVDNQIATYLPFVDHFVTGDNRFLSAVDLVRNQSPIRLALGHHLEARLSAFDQLIELMPILKVTGPAR